MRRFLMPVAIMCALVLVASNAWAQTPPSLPTPVPPSPAPPSPPVPTIPPRPTPDVPQPTPPPETEPTLGGPVDASDPGDDTPTTTPTREGGANEAAPDTIWWDVGYRYPGIYSTARLLSLLSELEKTQPSAALRRRAAAPFIVLGYARFWDSWGEVRHADSGLRPHLGQDVFCDYGSPVLASEHGTLEYGQDATGGLVARVHRGEGSYWYYAHLSRFEPARSSGDEVEPGDVIGYCGTSGNAAGTPPHVHFGFFVDHVAMNPMGALIEWLDEAESHAARLLKKAKRPVPETAPASKHPLEVTLARVPGERCYIPLPKEPIELVVGSMPEIS